MFFTRFCPCYVSMTLTLTRPTVLFAQHLEGNEDTKGESWGVIVKQVYIP